jgi:hypothetical protein
MNRLLVGRVLSLGLLVVLVVLALSACGGDEKKVKARPLPEEPKALRPGTYRSEEFKPSLSRGGLYYTRSKKVGGRVVREYVGSGILGHVAALQDAQERQRREQEAALWKEERKRLEALVAPVEDLCEATEVLCRAALLAAGYRRHQRGEWRRKREPKE